MGSELLSSQDASSSNSLNLLFGLAGEEASLHDDWLLGESSLTKNLEKASPGAVNHRCLGSLSSILHPGRFRLALLGWTWKFLIPTLPKYPGWYLSKLILWRCWGGRGSFSYRPYRNIRGGICRS